MVRTKPTVIAMATVAAMMSAFLWYSDAQRKAQLSQAETKDSEKVSDLREPATAKLPNP